MDKVFFLQCNNAQWSLHRSWPDLVYNRLWLFKYISVCVLCAPIVVHTITICSITFYHMMKMLIMPYITWKFNQSVAVLYQILPQLMWFNHFQTQVYIYLQLFYFLFTIMCPWYMQYWHTVPRQYTKYEMWRNCDF